MWRKPTNYFPALSDRPIFNQATFNKPHQNFDDMQNFNSTKMAKYLKKSTLLSKYREQYSLKSLFHKLLHYNHVFVELTAITEVGIVQTEFQEVAH